MLITNTSKNQPISKARLFLNLILATINDTLKEPMATDTNTRRAKDAILRARPWYT